MTRPQVALDPQPRRAASTAGPTSLANSAARAASPLKYVWKVKPPVQARPAARPAHHSAYFLHLPTCAGSPTNTGHVLFTVAAAAAATSGGAVPSHSCRSSTRVGA